MKWSWRIFTAFGIEVNVHATFLLLLLLGLFSAWNDGGGLYGGLSAVLVILAVFACVVLHEFGHSLMARRFGVRTRDITLYPIGGMARLEKIPDDPRQELPIALAGPVVNLVIAAVLAAAGLLFGWGPETDVLHGKIFGSAQGFLWWLVSINLALALFNFIPAFPMDGGRVLRALLALKMDYVKATRIAVSVGQALAFAFGLYGLLNGHFLLTLVAFFVYLGAGQEGALVQVRRSFHGLPASSAMITRFTTLQETDRLETAVEHLLVGSQVDFPVMRDDQVVGLLTRSVLIDALGKKGPLVTISSVPLREVASIQDNMPLDLAFEALQTGAVPCLPVMRQGRLVGLLTLENLAEFAMVQTAMRLRDQARGMG